MKLFPKTSGWFGGLFAAAICLLSISGAKAQLLWYNGDRNAVNSMWGTSDGTNAEFVYDDFNVTAPGGWQVSSVFVNIKLLSTVDTANWEILSGVSSGNGGTVVQSGTGSALTLTPLSTLSGGYTLYQASVNDLSFNLAPGTYWLGVQPISSDPGYIVTTSGASAVGTPAGNDGNAYYSQTDGIPGDGVSFASTTTVNPNLIDFSMGVMGTASVPEPSSSALCFVGFGLLVVYLRKRLARV